jgi:hypothetical protein
MLTPGMNDHGLGPGIGEFTFGHGGADEGFRAELTAWKDQPNALVIMVNSDNGSIIPEIKLAIAREYNLPGIEPDIKKRIELPVDELSKYCGKYRIDAFGALEIFHLDKDLGVYADFIGDTLHLFPESDTLFYDRMDGTEFRFKIEDDSVTAFEVQRFTANRIP